MNASQSLCLTPLLLSGLAACHGGSASSSASTAAPVGAVYVVVDTAAGTDALVQFQVAAAVLVTADGAATGNVLQQSTMLTMADPSGEVSGLTLTGVPDGQYAFLHLMVVPGSGAALKADGTIVPVSCATDLSVPILDGLQHSSLANSWLLLGHDAAAPSLGSGGGDWTPSLAGRSDGSAVELGGLPVAAVLAPTLAVTLPSSDDGVLQVEFDGDCSFVDEDIEEQSAHHGGVAHGPNDSSSFLTDMTGDDRVFVNGELRRDGSFRAHHARRHRGSDGPRLLGRITELRPATTSFVMEVHAEVRRGGERRFLENHVSVLVSAGQARLHRADRRVSVAFAELAVGNLAKVSWTSRTPVAGGLDEIVAREVEVTSEAEAMHPEWQGLVQSVDLATGTIVVEPRGDDPIVIGGTAVAQAEVVVGQDTVILRKSQGGGGQVAITIDQIVAGADRIWWRGEVTGPNRIAATWVRVRAE